MLSAWGKCVEDALVAFHGFKSSPVVLPCLQKEKERKKEGYLLSVRSQALKSWG